MKQSKQFLRAKYLDKLKKMSDHDRQKINKQLQKSLFQCEEWLHANIIGITISQTHEWETWPIIEQAWLENKQVAAPKCDPATKQLSFYLINSKQDLAVQHYRLMEPISEQTIYVRPNDLDLLLVPGLVYDRDYYRIGYGGGYYDRFLANYHHSSISLVWREQIVDELLHEPFDQPVTHLIIVN
ncbi:5-formyltetrahydrofolate cyclo-ligase [Amphibacillus cookii]|uniref:5-formyltetrahydrofolate cyclo-ligase n=1 Tax=Amphibacillus cookii TaxID=767787 RepID=UPI00195E3A4B|nr:5-formyltetrahydrofolate cyclo-ligase [Amphibacillus cookii]MBM7542402.1 5-formyltetrahydrofolate cyclo-ligase [Amphibacillus cookii]